MAYASWSVVFGEQPSASKWNILGTNDASFNDGTGLPTYTSATALVTSNQSTTSGAYADLTTTTDTVTVTIGATGLALVFIEAEMDCSTAGIGMNASVTVSGANSATAGTIQTVPIIKHTTTVSAARPITKMAHILQTGLAAGSTTYKMKYNAGGGIACFFANRRISVIVL